MVEKKEIIQGMDLIREGLLILAMGLESTGRAKRIISKDKKADDGMVMATQLIYSIAYGIEDYKKKLTGVKYAEQNKK
jgi:hypothetical protein